MFIVEGIGRSWVTWSSMWPLDLTCSRRRSWPGSPSITSLMVWWPSWTDYLQIHYDRNQTISISSFKRFVIYSCEIISIVTDFDILLALFIMTNHFNLIGKKCCWWFLQHIQLMSGMNSGLFKAFNLVFCVFPLSKPRLTSRFMLAMDPVRI